MDNKTLLILGLAAGGILLYSRSANAKRGHWSPGATVPHATGAGAVVNGQSDLPSVLTDGGGNVPASPETAMKVAGLQAARSLGLSAKSKASRGAAAAIAMAGGRALQTGARKGYSVTAKQAAVVKAVAKSTPQRPKKKKSRWGVVGTITSLGGSAIKTTVNVHKKAVTAQLNFAKNHPDLTSAAVGAVAGPGAGAATKAGLTLYNNRTAGGAAEAYKTYRGG